MVIVARVDQNSYRSGSIARCKHLNYPFAILLNTLPVGDVKLLAKNIDTAALVIRFVLHLDSKFDWPLGDLSRAPNRQICRQVPALALPTQYWVVVEDLIGQSS